MDLAILIDCTASMWRELADAQASADDLVEFLDSVTGGARVAIIGYRDRGDSWKTRAWDFTRNIEEARTRLWSLSAEGGGDGPEAVHSALDGVHALRLVARFASSLEAADPRVRARRRRAAAPRRRRALRRARAARIRQRDRPTASSRSTQAKSPRRGRCAPPEVEKPAPTDKAQPGDGGASRERPVAPPRPPPPSLRKRTSSTWFPEIADAGGGRAELLKQDGSLVAQIAN
jgi:hypothetical protein